MDYYKLKRYAPFLYYIPAILVIFLEILIPGYLFLMLILPYVVISFLCFRKLPKESIGNVDYIRLAFLAMTHVTLYILMYHR